jgi:hypothetical protein
MGPVLAVAFARTLKFRLRGKISLGVGPSLSPTIIGIRAFPAPQLIGLLGTHFLCSPLGAFHAALKHCQDLHWPAVYKLRKASTDWLGLLRAALRRLERAWIAIVKLSARAKADYK